MDRRAALLVALSMTTAALPAPAAEAFASPVTAEGDLIIIEGRVLDRAGDPVTEAVVEIWQTDARGIYDHPGDASTGGRDLGFQFYGSSPADRDGRYAFRTILPGRYHPRPRHIHVKVKSGGRVLLVTQIYFAEDGEARGVGGSAENLRVEMRSRNAPDGSRVDYAVFDIVLDTGVPGPRRPTDRQGEGPYYPVADVSAFDNDLANVGG